LVLGGKVTGRERLRWKEEQDGGPKKVRKKPAFLKKKKRRFSGGLQNFFQRKVETLRGVSRGRKGNRGGEMLMRGGESRAS